MRRLAGAILVSATVTSLTGCAEMRENLRPVCEVRNPTILMAESIASASLIPCVRSLPIGWSWGDFRVEDGHAMFVLDSTAGGDGALDVELVPLCTSAPTTAGAAPTPNEVVRSRDPYSATRTYAFEGGCAIVRIAFVAGAPVDRLLGDIEGALGFIERGRIDRELRETGERGLDPVDV
jgi:hypothetical protein